MLSLGKVEGEMESIFKVLLKLRFYLNIKFVVFLKSYGIWGMIYFNSIKVNYYLMRKIYCNFYFLYKKN